MIELTDDEKGLITAYRAIPEDRADCREMVRIAAGAMKAPGVRVKMRFTQCCIHCRGPLRSTADRQGLCCRACRESGKATVDGPGAGIMETRSR